MIPSELHSNGRMPTEQTIENHFFFFFFLALGAMPKRCLITYLRSQTPLAVKQDWQLGQILCPKLNPAHPELVFLEEIY